MQKVRRAVAVLSLTILGAGCHHATVETGRPPSGTTIENNWAHSFVYGLVPPSTVETASRCPAGVAQVDTKRSFLNGLVSTLTWGLYSPMTITVQCASPMALDNVPSSNLIALPDASTREAFADALNHAVGLTSDSGETVYVQFSELE